MTRVLLLPLFVTIGLLAACDVGPPYSPPPGPGPAPQTRVVGVRLSPDTVAALDTVLIHVLIEDSLDTRFRFLWGMPNTLPVDGRLDGLRIRHIAPRTSTTPGLVSPAGSSVIITNDVPGSSAVTHSFSIPVRN